MGCAGSKPHLNNHSTNHTNSPQKGFIIFNSKTIDYIKAHENELKQKIKEKCEPKLFGNKTLKSKAKKNLSKQISEQNNGTPTSTQNVSGSEPATVLTNIATDNNQSIINSTLNNEKEMATLDLAIDLVLKYVINDFDIENFKSNSNHLSLKQIRKDILKKYNTIPNESTNSSSGKASTLTKAQNTAAHDSTFYKKALTTAIDEFGTVIQEQFIAINEFKSPNEENKPADVSIQTNVTPVAANEAVGNNSGEYNTDKENIPIVDDSEELHAERLLTLKEAMEQARQNFYRGKMSMICMTKSGSYILKDVKEDENAHKDARNEEKAETIETEPVTPILKPKTVTMFDTETRKTSKIAIAPQINIEDADISATFKIIETSLDEEHAKIANDEACKAPNYIEEVVREPTIVPDRGLNKLLQDQIELRNLINKTTEASLNYSKHSSSSSKDDKLKYANELNGELAKVKTIVLTLKDLSENESDDNLKQLNEIFLKTIIDFNKANRSLIPYIDAVSKEATDDYDLKIINHEIKTNANEINELVKNLPDRVFKLKSLPTPNEVSDDGSASTTTTTTTITTTTTTLLDDNNEKTKVDVKKEIAISILNIGEVLAKTIDHYTIEKPASTQVVEESVNNLGDTEIVEAKGVSAINTESVSPPQPPSPSIQVSTPASTSSIDVDKLTTNDTITLDSQKPQDPQEQQDQNEQTHNDSTSFSSPSDLLSSLSSSSALSSPHKIDDVPSTSNTDDKTAPDTIEDNMSYLMREMENKLSAHLDFFADKIAQNPTNTVEIRQVVIEDNNGHGTVKQFVDTVIETATNQVDNDNDESKHKKTNGVSTHKNGKRLSIDEELLNHINEVDKKVKYLTETCSEDDDDDYGVGVNDDNDQLFQPTKSNRIDVNSNELHEEIKQISNVIQDLVQTINQNPDNDQLTTITTTTTTTTIINDNGSNLENETKRNGKVADRKSLSSVGSTSFSSIPVRKPILTKQKATIDDENGGKTIETTNLITADTTNDSFNDSNFTNSARHSLDSNTTADIMNTSNNNSGGGGGGKKKYKSKLPVKK